MIQSKQLLQTLKKELKANGLTYSHVAAKLKLSEASVKRLFSENSFTLQRLESVCEMLALSITDLVEANSKNQHKIDELSLEQEQELAGDLTLLLIAVSVMNRMSFEQIVEHYQLSESDCIQKLAKLDRLKFLELLPGNRIKILLSNSFRWQKNGPIQQFFLEKVEKDFFNSKFQNKNEKLIVLNGMFTPATNVFVQEKMQSFSLELAELIQQDASKPLEEKKGNTIVFALREWQFGLFTQLLRKS